MFIPESNVMNTKSLGFGRRYFSLPLILSILLIFTSCKKSTNDYSSTGGGGNPGANEVWMQSSSFSPASLTVAVNSTVTWTNKDSYTHTVTSDTGLFDSGNIAGGGTYSYKFTSKGTFKYHCKIHAMMTGQIVVQ